MDGNLEIRLKNSDSSAGHHLEISVYKKQSEMIVFNLCLFSSQERRFVKDLLLNCKAEKIYEIIKGIKEK